jgi:hypothetical protein
MQGVLFKPAKWKEQASVYMGLPPPETRKSVNQHIIIKGIIRGKVDLHANNLLNSHYATGGGTSLNHNTILGNVEVGLHDAGVPFKSTGSTNGQGTKNTFRRQLPENLSGSSRVGRYRRPRGLCRHARLRLTRHLVPPTVARCRAGTKKCLECRLDQVFCSALARTRLASLDFKRVFLENNEALKKCHIPNEVAH